MQSGVDWHMSQSINSICHCFAGKWKIGPSLGRDFSGIENEDGIAKKNSKPLKWLQGVSTPIYGQLPKLIAAKTADLYMLQFLHILWSFIAL